jgi:hypothetical protein
MTISVLIIAQDHQDHFPLLTVEKIAKCSKDSGLKVSIGYELVPDDIKKINNQKEIIDLRNEYLDEKTTPERKDEVKKEIMKSHHFLNLKESCHKQGINLEEKFDQYIGNGFDPDPYIQVSSKMYKTNKSMIKLTGNYDNFYIDLDSKELEQEYLATQSVTKDTLDMYAKYEKPRIDYMVKSIFKKIQEHRSNDLEQNSIILIGNLGSNHVTRLQESLKERLFSDKIQDTKIFSLRIETIEMMGKIDEDQYAKVVGDYEKLSDAMQQIPTVHHNGLKTSHLEVDNCNTVLRAALENIGYRGIIPSLYYSDKEGPLRPLTPSAKSLKTNTHEQKL